MPGSMAKLALIRLILAITTRPTRSVVVCGLQLIFRWEGVLHGGEHNTGACFGPDPIFVRSVTSGPFVLSV